MAPKKTGKVTKKKANRGKGNERKSLVSNESKQRQENGKVRGEGVKIDQPTIKSSQMKNTKSNSAENARAMITEEDEVIDMEVDGMGSEF